MEQLDFEQQIKTMTDRELSEYVAREQFTQRKCLEGIASHGWQLKALWVVDGIMITALLALFVSLISNVVK